MDGASRSSSRNANKRKNYSEDVEDDDLLGEEDMEDHVPSTSVGKSSRGKSKKARGGDDGKSSKRDDEYYSHKAEEDLNSMLANLQNVESDEDEEDDETPKQGKSGSLGNLNAGAIMRIYVENFMCHRKFDMALGAGLNFITGRNGSGTILLFILCSAIYSL